jgi:hypothetical protein
MRRAGSTPAITASPHTLNPQFNDTNKDRYSKNGAGDQKQASENVINS